MMYFLAEDSPEVFPLAFDHGLDVALGRLEFLRYLPVAGVSVTPEQKPPDLLES